MTISSTTLRRTSPYNGNGVTTAFTVTFVFQLPTDLQVIKKAVSTGTETTLTYITDYTVTGGSGSSGSATTGTVTLNTALPSGFQLIIVGDAPVTQGEHLVNNNPLDAPSLEWSLDRQTIWRQEVDERLSRAILSTAGSGLSGVNISSPVAGNILKWNADLQTIDNASTAGLALTGAIAPGTGVIISTDGVGGYTTRSIAGTGGISITNGDGVSGNPSVALNITGLTADASPDGTADYVVTYDASASANKKVLLNNLPVTLDADLVAIAALSTTGLAVRTASNTWALRSLTAPAAGISITNPDGVSGSPTFALANDLSALEGLSGTGIAVRTTTDTWTQRSITASNGVAVSNGDGVSGNPALSADVSGLTADSSPDGTADYVMTYDASAGTNKKVLINTLVTAGSSGGGSGASLGLSYTVSKGLFLN